MNILVLTQLYHIEGRADLFHDTSAVHYLVKNWTAQNHVYVINTYINYRNHIFRYLNPKNLRYYLSNYYFSKDGVNVCLIENQLLTRRFFQQWNWKRLRRKVRRIMAASFVSEPDLIVSHFPCYSYGFIDRIPCKGKKVAVLHRSDVYSAEHDPLFFEALEHNFDACYARSKSIQEYFDKRGLKNLRQGLVLSGAPVEGIRSVRNWAQYRANPVRILYAGKLIERKHIDWIIDAMTAMKKNSCELNIVGDGPELEQLKQRSAELRLDNVYFHASVDRAAVLDYMGQADIFCMPSTNETFGLVYLEAMASGCITIGTAGEGIDGVLEDCRNGYLIKDKDELRALLQYLVCEVPISELSQVSERAIDTAMYYSEENVSERYLKMILEDD